MKVHGRTPAWIVAVVFAIIVTNANVDICAQEISFKFNPSDSITFLQNLKASTATDMGALGKRNEVTESSARITIMKEGAGYRLIATPLSVATTLNGQPVDNPIVSLLQNVVVQYWLDGDGQIDSIGGYEELMRLMQSMLPPEALQSVASILNPVALSNRDKAEWNGKIGSFVGRSAKIGEAWTSADSFALPSGQTINFYSVVKFSAQVKCGEKDCVKVEYRYNSDGAKLFEFAGKFATDVAQAMGDTTHKMEMSGGEITGQGERLIDPSTMLIQSETLSRTMKAKMNIPGQGEVDLDQVETREYSYDYTY